MKAINAIRTIAAVLIIMAAAMSSSIAGDLGLFSTSEMIGLLASAK